MRKGDQEALDLLVKYNKEDIVNLKTIIELTYPKMVEKALRGLKLHLSGLIKGRNIRQ